MVLTIFKDYLMGGPNWNLNKPLTMKEEEPVKMLKKPRSLSLRLVKRHAVNACLAQHFRLPNKSFWPQWLQKYTLHIYVLYILCVLWSLEFNNHLCNNSICRAEEKRILECGISSTSRCATTSKGNGVCQRGNTLWSHRLCTPGLIFRQLKSQLWCSDDSATSSKENLDKNSPLWFWILTETCW